MTNVELTGAKPDLHQKPKIGLDSSMVHLSKKNKGKPK